MQINHMAAAAIFAAMLATPPAHAQESARAYKTKTMERMALCEARLALATVGGRLALQSDDGDAFVKCLSSGKDEAAALLAKAIVGEKSPRAREAIRAYHAAYLSSLTGLMPRKDEIKLDYDRRQSANETERERAWAAVDASR